MENIEWKKYIPWIEFFRIHEFFAIDCLKKFCSIVRVVSFDTYLWKSELHLFLSFRVGGL